MNLFAFQAGYLNKEAAFRPGDAIYKGAKKVTKQTNATLLRPVLQKMRTKLSGWANKSELGNDLRSVYRQGREWYKPTQLSAVNQELYNNVLEAAERVKDNPELYQKLLAKANAFKAASLRDEHTLKKAIVWAGLLPPAVGTGIGVGANLISLPAYDIAKGQLSSMSKNIDNAS